MSVFDRFPRRFRLPWRTREQIGAEVDEEISLHLELRTAELVAQGVDPDSARRQALCEFGDVEQARDSLAGADRSIEFRRRRLESIQDVVMDLRLAARSLRRGRTATLATILTLSLGIGAVTTVFSLVNWISLRPVPGVADPNRLVVVQMRESSGDDETSISIPNLMDLREHTPAFRALAGYSTIGLQAAADGAPTLPLMGELVAGDYFGTLGLRPARGRFFSPEERASTAPSYQAVISHGLWRSHFDADATVTGRRLRLNGVDFTVVGVAPEGFRGPERLGETDVWLPVSVSGTLWHDDGFDLRDRGRKVLEEFIGRLQPGATAEAAQAQLRATMARLVEAYPEENEIYTEYLPTVYTGIGLGVEARPHVARTLSLMGGVVGLVLLIAWANVGNLLLLRGLRRRGETAVRRALGASTGRLLRTHLAEGLLVGVAGGTAGMLLALAATRVFPGHLSRWLPEIERVGLDWRVLTFAVALSLLSGGVFGIIPVAATDPEHWLQHLKQASRTITGRASWLRNALVVAQVSCALVLLIAALFLARTVHTLSRVEVGLETEGVVTFILDPSALGYTPERNQVFREQLRDEVSGLPGVESVTLASGSPFGGSYMNMYYRAPAMAEDAWEVVPVIHATPEYFATLGIPLMAGRGLQESSAQDEVVISRALAHTLFGDANPVGRQILRRRYQDASLAQTIVGVVADTRVRDLRAPSPDPVVYGPLSAMDPDHMGTVLLVRSALPRHETEAAVRDAVAAIEPSLAIWATEGLSQAVRRTIGEERSLARMATLLGALAAVLAALGIYAVFSYAVTQRTREIGIRMAIGARGGAIVRLLSRDAAPLILAGIGLGTLVALFGSRALESRLFGVGRFDPLVYAAAGGLFAIVAMLALWTPFRAAQGVEPTEALRQE